MKKHSPVGLLLLLMLLGCLAGCGDSRGTVKGTVTVGGQPLKKGEIVFSPPSGGTPVGAPVVDGKYTAKMIPGERVVLITESIEVEPILSTEEMQRQAESGAKPAPVPVSKITEATPGNKKTVTVTKGEQTHDFTLQP
jgi:hypothetical protein